MMLGLSGVVPAPLLMGIVGGSGVPKFRRVGAVGFTAPDLAVPPAYVAAVVSRVGACAPLPMGGAVLSLLVVLRRLLPPPLCRPPDGL